MQSELDRERIQAIGADPQKVTVFGNLKYDVAPRAGTLRPELVRMLEDWTRVWIAASTMPGEEEIILEAYRKVRMTHTDLKLVIAPRSPERFDLVGEMLRQSDSEFIRRSKLKAGSPASASILLLDSIGELAALFHYATIVFMGGSLVARGGHNILEPARHGKPIVFGPHMENFRDISRLFLEANAAMQIEGPDQLVSTLSDLLSDTQKADSIGRNALAVVEQNTGATDRVLQVLEPVGAVGASR
jgi:3-deoxy-D-manno-octulosonic-acid transferase